MHDHIILAFVRFSFFHGENDRLPVGLPALIDMKPGDVPMMGSESRRAGELVRTESAWFAPGSARG